MRTLWIGIHTNDAVNKEILALGGKLMSGKVAEGCLLEGFDAIMPEKLDTVNSFRYPAFPKGPMRVKRVEWQRTEGARDVSVSYLNLPYLSILSREKALVKEAKAWCRAVPKDEPIRVLVYSMHSPFMKAAAAIKRMRPDACVSMLVLDLPQFMDLHMSRLKKLLKAMDWRKIKKLMKKVDKYVLYSRHMASFLGLKDGSWTVMEGAFDTKSAIDETPEKQAGKLPIMYSGILDMRYGIPELLDAFSELDGRFELWFTGTGNAVPLIEERAKNDPRIKNFGFLPSRRELLLKQKEAAMLISTRRSDEAASDYCFPSKLFEYMVSGNPVLSARIGGIPEEYFDYLIEMKSTSAADIRAAILAVADMSEEERQKRGEAGRRFILEQKNNKAQAAHILSFTEK